MSQNERKYKLISVGHVCHDLLEDDYILGGSVSYSSAFTSSNHKASAIITSYGDDFQFAEFFTQHHIDVINCPASATTIFQNVYIGDDRWQYLRSRASTIDDKTIIDSAKYSDILLLCPIADEINIGVLDQLENDLIGLTIQGWLRQWDSEGRVSSKPMEWDKLAKADFVFLSYEDLGPRKNIIPKLKTLGNTIVITNDQLGADIFTAGQHINLPSWSTDVVDPTGAGDTFASAFLLSFRQSKDLTEAAIYAHCAASLIIEQQGMEYHSLPDRLQTRVEEYKSKFKL